jgi:hypothetical protein
MELEYDVVSICEHRGELYVATTRHIYVKIGDEFVVMKFKKHGKMGE